MTRLLFLIRSLEIGGAERQLLYLVQGLDKRHFDVTLATFYDGGALRPECLKIAGVRVVSLGKQGRWDLLRPGGQLWRLIRDFRPHVVHGYMSVANELSLVAGRLAGARVVWGLRASNMDLARYDWASVGSFRLAAGLSRCVDLQIYNSFAGREWHVARGYRGPMAVIPNGICGRRFQRNRAAGMRLRQQWGVGEEETLVGIVARLDPMKDHPTFLRCAARLVSAHPHVRLVCVGAGPAAYRHELHELARQLGLEGKVTFAGPTAEPAAAYSALDLLVSSSSFGEGTSNSVAEAMACELPCCVTDVGDSARMVRGVGKIVPPADPTALAAAVADVLGLSSQERRQMGRAGRQRVLDQFSLKNMIGCTEQAIVGLLR